MSYPAKNRASNKPAAASRNTAFLTCMVAASLTIFTCGCMGHKVRASAPVTVPPKPPAPISTSGTTKSPDSIPAPTTPAPKNPEPATLSPALTPKPDTVKRPTTVVPEPESERPPAPEISPQMSQSDQVELTKQTQQYVTTAQENLHRADGRELNTSQHDMADKIRGFLEQAQDAIRTSDWSRAKNLSQKAYLLSVELVKTL
ncbi:MAG TPA: hypothetical protein VFD93_06255 [Candidatus Acidoferrales bacterium]|nr:hypothetical protein [Candidatus Acidoferrales bacterium]